MARKGYGIDSSLQTALLETTSAATTGAIDGQKIFSSVAAFLNRHCNQPTGLASHLLRAFITLSHDLASVAQWDFNVYISGILLTSIPPGWRPLSCGIQISELRCQIASSSRPIIPSPHNMNLSTDHILLGQWLCSHRSSTEVIILRLHRNHSSEQCNLDLQAFQSRNWVLQ